MHLTCARDNAPCHPWRNTCVHAHTLAASRPKMCFRKNRRRLQLRARVACTLRGAAARLVFSLRTAAFPHAFSFVPNATTTMAVQQESKWRVTTAFLAQLQVRFRRNGMCSLTQNNLFNTMFAFTLTVCLPIRFRWRLEKTNTPTRPVSYCDCTDNESLIRIRISPSVEILCGNLFASRR